MPTIRSEFTYQQYEKQLQALAYKIALEAIQDMNNKEAKFRTKGKEIREIQTDTWHIQFYSRRVNFSPGRMKKSEWGGDLYFHADWGCEVEEKIYSDGLYNSKIHFDVGEQENLQEKRDMIMEFLAKLMGDIKPEKPAFRFSLQKLVEQETPQATAVKS
jgi:hypothetical protein